MRRCYARPMSPSPPPVLSASIVTCHSDLTRLAATLAHLDAAVATAQLDTVTVTIVDQSLDAAYAGQLAALINDTVFTVIAPVLRIHPRNDGYGTGHNLAQGDGVGRYALILNPDVELAADALAAGLAVLDVDDRAVLVAPVSRGAEGRREYLAKDYPSVRVLLLRAFAPAWLQRYFVAELARYELRHLDAGPQPVSVVLASGACMLIRGATFATVGGFDEDYFLYFEDYDLSLRLTPHGRLLQVPEMLITHHGGGAARKGLKHIRWFVTNGCRFFNRWGWRWW